MARPVYDGSDVGDLLESWLGACIPFRSSLAVVRQPLERRDGLRRTPWRGATKWPPAPPRCRVGPGRSPQCKHLSGQRWALCDAMELLNTRWPRREHPELVPFVRGPTGTLCVLAVELLGEDLGLGRDDTVGGDMCGGGLARTGGLVDDPPPAGPALGAARRPLCLRPGDNRFATRADQFAAYCHHCSQPKRRREGAFSECRMRVTQPEDRANMWGTAEASGEFTW